MKLILIIFVLNNNLHDPSITAGDGKLNLSVEYARPDLDPDECVFMAATINQEAAMQAGDKWAACTPDLKTM